MDARLTMISFFQAYMVSRPHLLTLLKVCWEVEDSTSMQFLLDCSIIPIVIKTCQESEKNILEDIFFMTRTYVFKIETTRRRLLESAFQC